MLETDAEQVVRLEGLTREAQRSAQKAGLSVSDWLGRMTEEERQNWDGVEEMLAVWEKVDRELRERNAWMRRLWFSDKASKDAIFTDQWLEDAEKRMKELGITLDELKAADYIFERAVAAKHGRLTNAELDMLEQNIAREEQEHAEARKPAIEAEVVT